MKAKVFFSREITPQKVVELYQKLQVGLPGRVAVKVHSGEEGNQNFLRPPFWRPMIDLVQGTVVECNTAYEGSRNTTVKHMKLVKKHGWTDYFDVDIMDGEGPDIAETGGILWRLVPNRSIQSLLRGARVQEKLLL